MSEDKRQKKKGGKRMAVLTAQCDQPFVVAASKAKAFKEQTRDVKAFQKMDMLTSKISKNVKIDIKEK